MRRMELHSVKTRFPRTFSCIGKETLHIFNIFFRQIIDFDVLSVFNIISKSKLCQNQSILLMDPVSQFLILWNQTII